MFSTSREYFVIDGRCLSCGLIAVGAVLENAPVDHENVLVLLLVAAMSEVQILIAFESSAVGQYFGVFVDSFDVARLIEKIYTHAALFVIEVEVLVVVVF